MRPLPSLGGGAERETTGRQLPSHGHGLPTPLGNRAARSQRNRALEYV